MITMFMEHTCSCWFPSLIPLGALGRRGSSFTYFWQKPTRTYVSGALFARWKRFSWKCQMWGGSGRFACVSLCVVNIALRGEKQSVIFHCCLTFLQFLLQSHKLPDFTEPSSFQFGECGKHSPCLWSRHICRRFLCWCPVWCRDLDTLVSTGPGWGHQQRCCPPFLFYCFYKPRSVCWIADAHHSAAAKRNTIRYNDITF